MRKRVQQDATAVAQNRHHLQVQEEALINKEHKLRTQAQQAEQYLMSEDQRLKQGFKKLQEDVQRWEEQAAVQAGKVGDSRMRLNASKTSLS